MSEDLDIDDILADAPEPDKQNPDVPQVVPVKKPKHAGGRPRKWTLPRLMELVSELRKAIVTDDNCLSLEWYLATRQDGFWPEQIGFYGQEFPEFSSAIKQCHLMLAAKIDQMSLKGKLASKYAQFSMGARFGWRLPVQETKSDVTVTASKGISINFTEVKDAGNVG